MIAGDAAALWYLPLAVAYNPGIVVCTKVDCYVFIHLTAPSRGSCVGELHVVGVHQEALIAMPPTVYTTGSGVRS